MTDLKIENGGNNKFSDFKARSKVRMKHFKVKMIGVCYVSGSEGYLELVQIIKPTSNVMLICVEVKLHGCKSLRCVIRLKCNK